MGIAAILNPGFTRIKEWADAGLLFDLIGATYSIFALGNVDISVLFMVIPFGLGILSYIFHHKNLKASSLISSA